MTNQRFFILGYLVFFVSAHAQQIAKQHADFSNVDDFVTFRSNSFERNNIPEYTQETLLQQLKIAQQEKDALLNIVQFDDQQNSQISPVHVNINIMTEAAQKLHDDAVQAGDIRFQPYDDAKRQNLETIRQLEQGIVAADNPINQYMTYPVRIQNADGSFELREYKNLYFGQSEEHEALKKKLVDAQKILHTRVKNIILASIIVSIIWRHYDQCTPFLVKGYQELLQNVAHRYGNEAAQNVFVLCNVLQGLVSMFFMPVFSASLYYVQNTFGTWRETRNLPKEIERFDLKKGHWKLTKSMPERSLVIQADESQRYNADQDAHQRLLRESISKIARIA